MLAQDPGARDLGGLGDAGRDASDKSSRGRNLGIEMGFAGALNVHGCSRMLKDNLST